MAPYHRAFLPEGMNHADFGQDLASTSLFDPAASARITIASIPPVECDLPGSVLTYGEVGPIPAPYFLMPTVGRFEAGCAGPLEAISLTPDSAIIASDQELGVIEESLWHSALFFNRWLRNDASTMWRWRQQPGWTIDGRVAEGVNFCFHKFHDNYFHLIADSLPRVWLLKTKFPDIAFKRWWFGSNLTPTELKLLSLYDVSPDDLVLPQGEIVRFESILYPFFRFSEGLKTRPSFDKGVHFKGWSPEFLLDLRDRAHRRWLSAPPTPNRRLYITRRGAAHRLIENEDAVAALMERYGFEICDPGSLAIEDQVRLFAGASIVVGAHGAGFTNMLWPVHRAQMIEFMPGDLADPGYRFLCDMVGHRHHGLACEITEPGRHEAYADIRVGVQALEEMLRALD